MLLSWAELSFIYQSLRGQQAWTTFTFHRFLNSLQLSNRALLKGYFTQTQVSTVFWCKVSGTQNNIGCHSFSSFVLQSRRVNDSDWTSLWDSIVFALRNLSFLSQSRLIFQWMCFIVFMNSVLVTNETF